MMYRKTLIAFLLLLCTMVEVRAQASIDFIPAISGATLDGLMNVRITNTGSKKTVRLDIRVSQEDEVGSVQIVQITTAPFELNIGTNVVPPSIVRSAQVKIGTGETARFLQQNGYFPAGNYVYEYRMIHLSTQELLLEQTFIHELEPAAPLNLVEPYDRDEICEQRPLLSWQPHIPLTAGAQYQVVLTEVKDRQNGIEALQYNLPIINQKGIMANLIMYPAVARDLERGKRYAWQVTAYKGNTVLNRSEVWSFTTKCLDSTAEKHIDRDLGYRLIEDLARGSNYITSGILKITITNAYAPQQLQYEITCATSPLIRFKKLPPIQLIEGKNMITIDLSKEKALKDNYTYILKVWLPNGNVKQLRFIYKE
jgi:hypothetical protein